MAVPRFREGRLLPPLSRSTGSSMRLESISPALSATTSETRSPAPHGSGLRPARGHVWMAPGSQGFFHVSASKTICSHVSGLLARHKPQALMGSAGRGLIRLSGSQCPMSSDRCPSIRRLTDDAITRLHPRKSCVSEVLFLCSIRGPFLRRGTADCAAGRGSPPAASSLPNRCAPSYWRVHRRRPCAPWSRAV